MRYVHWVFCLGEYALEHAMYIAGNENVESNRKIPKEGNANSKLRSWAQWYAASILGTANVPQEYTNSVVDMNTQKARVYKLYSIWRSMTGIYTPK